MKKSLIVLTALFASAGWILFAFSRHDSHPVASKVPASETREDEDKPSSRAELDRSLAALALNAANHAAPAKSNKPEPAEAPSRDDDANGEPRNTEDVAREFDTAFAADLPPNAASRQTESAVLSAFRDPRANGARLGRVDCRQTRCRLAIEFADQEADKRVMKDIFTLLSSSGVDVDGLGFIVPTRETQSSGAVAATIHLYRVPTAMGAMPAAEGG